MDNFIVSARKYRPVTFDSVVGQQHITGTLKNAIHNNQLAQAFLFCGPRGVGKTTCARILAKTINCENITEQTEACGQCDSCRSFQNGNSFSIHELDAASNNSVEDIRSLIEQVRIPPQTGKYKIYIIDEVHMLSQQAFNAFLKTLEEPPSYAIFILATTEKHKILPTILSRCQIFDFNRIKVQDMAGHLERIAKAESIVYEMDGLHVIAQKADGGLRDALSMFDQITSFSNKQITYQSVIDNLNILDYDYYFQVLDAVSKQDAANALLIFDKVLNNGFDGGHFIAGLSSHLRNLLVAGEPSTLKLLEVSDNIKKRYLDQSKAISAGIMLSALNIANQCEINYRTSKNHRLQVELALLKMCHIATAIQLKFTDLPSAEADVKKKLTEAPSQVPTEQLNPSVNAARTVAVPVAQNNNAPVTTESKTTGQGEPSDKAVQYAPNKIEVPKAEEPKAVKGWGTAVPKKLLPDLDTILTEKKDDEEKLVEGNEFLAVSEGTFLEKWHEYATKLKQDNRITLFTIMTANAPSLQGTAIHVEVENAVQQQELKLGKIDILNFLRVSLRNYALDIHEIIVEKSKGRRPYTDQEKYDAMLTKNPALDKLRKAFDLGFS